MIAACKKNHAKVAVAHVSRYCPKTAVVRDLINSGRIGRVLEIRGRGKEDQRGGGEDLWTLGTHVLDLMQYLGGQPEWCFGSVQQDGRPISPQDVKPGNAGIGALAGDEVHAMYRLAGGRMAYFDSVRNAKANPTRFGLSIFGSKGVIAMAKFGYMGPVYLLPDPSWSPGRTGKKWISVSSAGPGQPETLGGGGHATANVVGVKDLIAAVEQDRQPKSSIYDARITTEMIVAVFESQQKGQLVRFPLSNRQNPLLAG